MIIEVATLHVRPGQEKAFEKAFSQAQPLICRMAGHLSHELQRCVEVANKYKFVAKWKDLESHMVAFRNSPEYLEWEKLLHSFFDPSPTVEHYETVKKSSVQ